MRNTMRWLVIIFLCVFFLVQTGTAASQPEVNILASSQFGPTDRSEEVVSSENMAAQIDPVAYPALKYVNTFGELQVPYYDEPTHLNTPGGVAVDGDRVWVTEYVGKRALLYNSDGTFVKQINRSMMYLEYVLAEIDTLCDVAVAPDHTLWLDFQGDLVHVDPDGGYLGDVINSPQMSYNCKGLTIDEAGRLFVSDRSTHKIYIFDSGGSYLQTIGTSEDGSGDPLEFSTPENIAVRGGMLYVAETGNDRIQVIDVSNLASVTYVDEIREFMNGATLDQLTDPYGVNVDATRIFITDTANNRVLVFDRATRLFLTTIGAGQGSDLSEWNRPYDIAVAQEPDERIYISDMNNHRVKQYDSALTLLRVFGETGVPYNTDGKHFVYPWQIQADHQGNLYVAETRTHRVVKVNSQGVPIDEFGEPGIPGDDTTHFNRPSGLAVDSGDWLYVSDQENHRVVIFDSTGDYVSTFGSQGDGVDQFNNPRGITIHPVDDTIYVVDSGNYRVQVYDHNWVHLGTIGMTGEEGTDDAHFGFNLTDIAVDSLGNVYMADDGNNRVQKCSPLGTTYDYTCNTFVGETGVKGDPFYHFQWIAGLGIDGNNNVYIVDHGLCIVTIFDSSGSFLGTLGGGLLPSDVTIAPSGESYVSVAMDHDILKYAPVDQGWDRVSIEKFGDNNLDGMPVMAVYNDRLYAGYHQNDGVQVWTMGATGDWTKEVAPALENPINQSFTSALVFDGNLYMGTVNTSNPPIGGQLLRTNGTNWDNVAGSGFSNSINYSISALAEFKEMIYAATSGGNMATDPGTPVGAQIWRSSTGVVGDWTKVLDMNSQGLNMNYAIRQLVVYDNALFALVDNWYYGDEIWRTVDGSTWAPVVTSGSALGDHLLRTMEVFGGYLYVVGYSNGVDQVWRCQTCDTPGSYLQTAYGPFNKSDQDRNGWIDNSSVVDLQSFNGYLYAWTRNGVNGSETWRSRNGTYWEQYNPLGLGLFADDIASGVLFNQTLYAGSSSTVVWEIAPRVEVFKAGSGSGNVASDPGGIDCGEACSAEFSQGTLVTMSAVAASGSTFTGWSGEGCSGTGLCVVTAGQWRNVTANFSKQPGAVTLTVNTQGDGMGLVTSLPAGISCGNTCQYAFPTGTVVSLTQQAQVGAFSYWSGACSGSASCQISLNSDVAVTANYLSHPPEVSSFAKNGVADWDLYFTPADFGSHFADLDGDSLLRVKIDGLPSEGILKYKGSQVNPGTWFSYDNLAYLFYQPAAGYTGSDSFTWSGSDGFTISPVPAMASLTIEPDLDQDGIGDLTETNVPPLDASGLSGDGNGDGLLDTSQDNVISLIYDLESMSQNYAQANQGSLSASLLGGVHYLTLELDNQYAFFDVVPMRYPSGNPPRPEVGDIFPFGFVEFTVKDIPPGSAVDVILYTNGSSLPDAILGYGAEEGDVKFHWYDFAFSGTTGTEVEQLVGGKLKYTIHYTDGLKGDDDLTANGFIKATFGVAEDWRFIYLPLVLR